MGCVKCCKTVILWRGCHGNSVSWVSRVPVQRVIPVAECWSTMGVGWGGGVAPTMHAAIFLSRSRDDAKQPWCFSERGREPCEQQFTQERLSHQP